MLYVEVYSLFYIIFIVLYMLIDWRLDFFTINIMLSNGFILFLFIDRNLKPQKIKKHQKANSRATCLAPYLIYIVD